MTEKKIYITEEFDRESPAIIDTENGILSPSKFHSFTIVRFLKSKSRLTNYFYKVELEKPDGTTKMALLTGNQVFTLIKPLWEDYSKQIQQYFIEYRDSPSF